MRLLSAKNNQGFTLLELIIVMAIIGILSATVLLNPGILDNRNKALDTSDLDLATKLQQQLYTYTITTGNPLPTDLVDQKLSSQNITILTSNGIVSSEINIPADKFYIAVSAEGTPYVGFNLNSKQYQTTSKCYNESTFTTVSGDCTGNSRFFVPLSGRLGTGRTSTN